MLRLVWHAAKVAVAHAGALPLRAAVALGAAGYGEPPRPDQLWKACAIVVPTVLVTSWALPQLTWVVSPSIEAWAVRPAPGPIQANDYVSFWLSDPLAGPRPVHVTKHALCLPGHMLSEIERPSTRAPQKMDGYYYCDGRLLGISKPYSGRRSIISPGAASRSHPALPMSAPAIPTAMTAAIMGRSRLIASLV